MMTANNSVDFKKTEKEFYNPKTAPVIIEIPEMTFIMLDGKGDPNDPKSEYSSAVETLYALSYNIKMNNKAVLEYVVPPLEGLWTVNDVNFKGGGAAIADKSKMFWTIMIRQPGFVNNDVFGSAISSLRKKKPVLDTAKARLERWTEGLCVQIMHIGSYDDEPASVKLLDDFTVMTGYRHDMDGIRRHHEIYISDPRKTPPEKLKTVIRHPITKQQ